MIQYYGCHVKQQCMGCQEPYVSHVSFDRYLSTREELTLRSRVVCLLYRVCLACMWNWLPVLNEMTGNDEMK